MSSSTSAWNWRVPGVAIPVPNSRRIDPTTPRALAQLTFDPASAYDLRRQLGIRPTAAGQFVSCMDKFTASDIAWLAGGASTDGQHYVAPNVFFPEFDQLRDATPEASDRKAFVELARKLMFDLVRIPFAPQHFLF